jgi:hypothetical protein
MRGKSGRNGLKNSPLRALRLKNGTIDAQGAAFFSSAESASKQVQIFTNQQA